MITRVSRNIVHVLHCVLLLTGTASALSSVGCVAYAGDERVSEDAVRIAPEKPRIVRCRLGLGDADYVVHGLSQSGLPLLGKYETKSEDDPGRTVVYRFDPDGRPVDRLIWPDGYAVLAMALDERGHIYSICRRQDSKQWRHLRMTITGDVLQDRDIKPLNKGGSKLSFNSEDWRHVHMTILDNGDIVVSWDISSATPEVGMIVIPTEGDIILHKDGIGFAQQCQANALGDEYRFITDTQDDGRASRGSVARTAVVLIAPNTTLLVAELDEEGREYKLRNITSRGDRSIGTIKNANPVFFDGRHVYSYDHTQQTFVIYSIVPPLTKHASLEKELMDREPPIAKPNGTVP